MHAFAREGDTVVISIDRLARNLDDLRKLVQSLTKRGVRIEFVKESLAFSGKDPPDGQPDALGHGCVRRIQDAP